MKVNTKALIITLVAMLATNVILRYYIFDQNIYSKLLIKIFLILATLLLLFKSHFLNEIKPNSKTFPYLIICSILFVLSFNHINSLIKGEEYLSKDITNIEFLTYCISIGVFEELFFRVYIYKTLHGIVYQNNKKLIKIIIISSLIFGLAHLSNLFNPNFIKISVINQVILAIAVGLLLQCIYIRTKSIILILTLHSLIDYFGTYKTILLSQRNLSDQNNYTYDFERFISTFIGLSLILTFIILPICYLLVKKELKTNFEKFEG